MAIAYVDTSCLVAITFGERRASDVSRRLRRFDDVFSANLLEAELRAACKREGIVGRPTVLSAISWIAPDRPLSAEIERVLDAGDIRGGVCWHLATALYLAGDPTTISFLTLDEPQAAVAETGVPGLETVAQERSDSRRVTAPPAATGASSRSPTPS